MREILGYSLVVGAMVATAFLLIGFFRSVSTTEPYASSGPRMVYEAMLLTSLVAGAGVFALTTWWLGLLAVLLHGALGLAAIVAIDRWA